MTTTPDPARAELIAQLARLVVSPHLTPAERDSVQAMLDRIELSHPSEE